MKVGKRPLLFCSNSLSLQLCALSYPSIESAFWVAGTESHSKPKNTFYTYSFIRELESDIFFKKNSFLRGETLNYQFVSKASF